MLLGPVGALAVRAGQSGGRSQGGCSKILRAGARVSKEGEKENPEAINLSLSLTRYDLCHMSYECMSISRASRRRMVARTEVKWR